MSTQRRQRITIASVATACAIASSVATFLVTTGKATIAARAEAREYVTGIATEIAHEAAAAAVAKHEVEVRAAMSPTGPMGQSFTAIRREVGWLVRDRACRIDKNTPCPPLADVLEPAP